MSEGIDEVPTATASPAGAAEAESVASVARLEALAEVTRQFALAGKALFGLAMVPGGLCLATGGLVLARGEVRLAAILALLTSPLLALAAAFARPWYARRGAVNESGASAGLVHPTPGELGGRVIWVLLWAWIFMTIPPVALALDPGRSGPSGPILVLPLVCALLTAAILHWRRPWRADTSWMLLLWLGFWSASFLGHRKEVVEGIPLADLDWYASFAVFFMVAFGLALATVGLYQHRRYRRTEVRLAALHAAAAVSFPPEVAP